MGFFKLITLVLIFGEVLSTLFQKKFKIFILKTRNLTLTGSASFGERYTFLCKAGCLLVLYIVLIYCKTLYILANLNGFVIHHAMFEPSHQSVAHQYLNTLLWYI